MFQEESPELKDDENFTLAHSVRHVSGSFTKNQEGSTDKASTQLEHGHQGEISVSSEGDQVKSSPSSTTTPQGRSKLTLDVEEIKTYINYYDEKMIDTEQGHGKQSKKMDNSSLEDVTYGDEPKGPLTEIINDDSVANQPAVTDIQECVNTNTECTTKTDVQSNQKDAFGGIIPDSVQDAVDALLFGLSTPSATKALDAGTPNITFESQWTLSGSQFLPDFQMLKF
ncbi:uncharacterized protein LOC124887994 [Capsicum annuum]|uniref:uncharacterized protein LOC124887994 n=1 Tax=Capsicum annuum TaxID=4072 RepID=UPI001FB1018C|nr:uncharacterized protein LOC124887994 [Capsicum annuum]